ncbi:SHOCT domain-containing protein [Leucothrix sargassi]|nr:SHOCT domain-containing protein [Leucothrix sargassi]
MQSLTDVGQNIVNDLSNRYNLSLDAVSHMLVAVNNGGGSMAQFNCPELGGSGQWMQGGMTMVGDMFNQGLQVTVSNLCGELSTALANNQMFIEAPAGTAGSNQWWPAELGQPFSSGGQNNSRYAVFTGRLAVEINGQVTVYDTLDHQIGGVSQQQGGNDSLTFSSQYGQFSVSSLPITNSEAAPVEAPIVEQFVEPIAAAPMNETYQQPSASADSSDVITLINKLAELHGAGILSDDEFSTKKAELLARL